jgi:hypothetical protein
VFVLKKVCLILGYILLTSFIFTGCPKKDVTKYNYNYKGENELWNVEYKVNSTVTITDKDGKLDRESESENVLIVTYKGELTDLSYVRHMEISFASSTHSGKKVSDYDVEEHISSKTFTLKSGGKNNAIPIENDIVKVTINIDGDTQTLELKNNQ